MQVLTTAPNSLASSSSQVRRAGLVPRGAIIVLAERDRGVVRHGEAAARGRGGGRGRGRAGGSMQAELAMMMQAMAEMPGGVGAMLGAMGGGAMVGAEEMAVEGLLEDASYEALMQLEETLGGAVSTGLQPADLARLHLTTLTEVPPDEQRCCICCCEYIVGDRMLSLACKHNFHPECIGPWLARKTSCPLCKQPALGGGDTSADPS